MRWALIIANVYIVGSILARDITTQVILLVFGIFWFALDMLEQNSASKAKNKGRA